MDGKQPILRRYFQGVYDEYQMKNTDVLGSISTFFLIMIVMTIFVSGMTISSEWNDDSWLILKSVSLALASMFSVIVSVTVFGFQFKIAVEMSMTRMETIRNLLILMFGMHWVMVALGELICRVTIWIWESQFGIQSVTEGNLIPAVVWILILFGPVVCGCLIGAVGVRFGSRFGWSMYFVFVIGVIGFNVVLPYLENISLPVTLFSPAGVSILIVAMLLGAVAMLRKVSV